MTIVDAWGKIKGNMDKVMDWDQFYIGMCAYVSQKSKDRTTKVGAIIVGDCHEVLSIGFNGFPRGVPDDHEPYHERPAKYAVTECGERNAIYNAARNGIRVEGSTLYLPFEPLPCSNCTRGIIQSGIRRIVGTTAKFAGKGKHWKDDLFLSEQMLDHAKIERVAIDLDRMEGIL